MNPITPLLMTDLILNCLWQAGCLTLVTLVVVLATRRLQIAMRKLILNLVMLSWLILPVWNFVAVPMDINLRQLSLGGEAEPVPAPTVPLIQPEILTVEPTMVADVMIPEGTFERAGSESSFLTTALNVIGLVWVVGILIGLAKLLIDQLALSRLLRNMEPVADARVLSLWSNFLGKKTKSSVPGLFLTDLVETPFSTGCFRARIVLPVCAVEHWSDEEIVAAMSHEFAHWQQCDLISCRLQRMARAIYWWNPSVAFLNRQLNHLQEVICDTIAVHSISSQRNYARLLIKIAENFEGARRVPAGSVGMARNISSLEQRIQTKTSKETNMKSITMKRRNVILACSTACCLALPLLGVQLTHADEHQDRHRAAVNEFHFKEDSNKMKKGSEDGIAEILIKQGGTTRMIRVPLNEEIRNARVRDLIEKMKIDLVADHERRVEKENRRAVFDDIDSDRHEIREIHFSTDEGEYGDSEHRVEEKVRVVVRKESEPAKKKSDFVKLADEDIGQKKRKAHVKTKGLPHEEVDVLVHRKVHVDGDHGPGLHVEKLDKHPAAILRERKDVALFIPEEIEEELRRDLKRSQDQIRRSEQQVKDEMMERTAKMQDEQHARQRKMEGTLRENQQQLEKMIAAMEKRIQILSRENEAIRKELGNAKNSLDK